MSKVNTVQEYIDQLPEKRKTAIMKLREQLLTHLPDGFQETMSYGMIGYVVPHSIYPKGYHVNPELPLPFINLASQKNHIAGYHTCIYTDEKLMKWFRDEYAKKVPTKLNMGKSCIRFTNPSKIPFELMGKLASKVTPQEWIEQYESALKQ